MQWCFTRNSHLKVTATITDEKSNIGNRDPRVFTPLSYNKLCLDNLYLNIFWSIPHYLHATAEEKTLPSEE